MPIAQQLVKLRKRRGISQAELALKSGLSVITIHRLENGKGSLLALLKVAEVLDGKVGLRSCVGPPDIANNFAKVRRDRFLSQQKLADFAGVSVDCVKNLEKGNHQAAQIQKIEKISHALGAAFCIDEKNAVFGFYAASRGKHIITKNDVYITPSHVIRTFERIIGDRFDLDPCAPTPKMKVKSHVNAKKVFTAREDGLAQRWFASSVWLNPPFSGTNVPDFLKKAFEEINAGHTSTVAFLVASRTDTRWFKDFIRGEHPITSGINVDIAWLVGRLRFEFWDNDQQIQASAPAPFPNIVGLINGTPVQRRRFFEEFKDCMSWIKYPLEPS